MSEQVEVVTEPTPASEGPPKEDPKPEAEGTSGGDDATKESTEDKESEPKVSVLIQHTFDLLLHHFFFFCRRNLLV